MSLSSYLDNQNNSKEIVLFLFFNFFAMLGQVMSRIGLDYLLAPVTKMIEIWPFKAQALGSFLSFLLANIIGKTISYSLNRRKNFKAHNSLKGLIIYYVMIVLIICLESIVGTPLRNALYLSLGGDHGGLHLLTHTVDNALLYQLCGVLAQWICGTVDAVIIFTVDKFVIMRCK